MSNVDVQLVFSIAPMLSDLVARNVRHVLETTSIQILNDANRSMEGLKHGRVYGSHIASAPGEAPAIDTGNLRGSGYQREVAYFEREVGYTAEYAEYLEGAQGLAAGTETDLEGVGAVTIGQGSGRLAPRPFLIPAVAKNVETFRRMMAKVLG